MRTRHPLGHVNQLNISYMHRESNKYMHNNRSHSAISVLGRTETFMRPLVLLAEAYGFPSSGSFSVKLVISHTWLFSNSFDGQRLDRCGHSNSGCILFPVSHFRENFLDWIKMRNFPCLKRCLFSIPANMQGVLSVTHTLFGPKHLLEQCRELCSFQPDKQQFGALGTSY